MSNVDIVRAALADSEAPWYGSDLVPRVADLCEDFERCEAELYDLRRVQYCDCGATTLDVTRHEKFCKWRKMQEAE